MTAQRKALLLRVGIDRGTGGVLSPIFALGTSGHLPIPEIEPTRCPKSFAGIPVPPGPDFDVLPYGHAAPHKRRQPVRLEPGALLVFCAGFAPWPRADIPRLFVLGCFEVEAAHSLTAHQVRACSRMSARLGNTAHFLRDPPDRKLALIVGVDPNNRPLEGALPLGDIESATLRWDNITEPVLTAAAAPESGEGSARKCRSGSNCGRSIRPTGPR